MKVLVACEESQAVCKAFRERGHEAYSCDIIECSGGHPEWHIQGDVLPLLNPKWYDLNRDGEGEQWEGIRFTTMDGRTHNFEGKWDMIIAFPPCTHLAVSGAAHFEKKRADGRQREGIEFFCQFLNVDCEKVVIENPVGIISGEYIPKWFPDLAAKYGLPRKATQRIQPWEHGDEAQKTTCLWLKGLPTLSPTKIVGKGEMKHYVNKTTGEKRTQPMWFFETLTKCKTSEERSRLRSKTFPGIAKAMAEQWG